MDRVIYVAMTGAREVTRQQAAVSHNLANVSTHGFKQEFSVFRALPVVGEGAKTRAFVAETTPRTDFSQGAIQHDRPPLDVALRVPAGSRCRTPAARRPIPAWGICRSARTASCKPPTASMCMGDAGPLALPPDQDVLIAKDGTVSTVPIGQNLTGVAIAGRIKLVNPPEADLKRGEDGLFRLAGGQPAEADANVQLISGALETSNVNPAEALVNMVSLARQFEMQMKVLGNAEDNHRSADKVLSAN
jgi:flagellar basal-body rod protein FlgF